ncbi:MAG: uS14 family ribosomal protein [Desulfurococcales archaeon]|nr:uS14 family ribosomal protein [Desulfurococcales archaeon]
MDIWIEAAREAASRAVGGGGEAAFPRHIEASIEEVSRIVAFRGRCPLCGKVLPTPRGYYLHLTRVHIRELAELIRSLSEGFVEGRRGGLV